VAVLHTAIDIGFDENPGRFSPVAVAPARRALGPVSFVARFIDNPLRVIPQSAYEEGLIYQTNRCGRVAWVLDPALIKDVLIERSDLFPITDIQKRVLGPLGGKGVLTTEGTEWRWQRQTVAPLFRHSELLQHVPAMATAANVMLAEWAADASPGYRFVDRDMTRVAYRVIARTLLPYASEEVDAAIERASCNYFKSISWSFVYGYFALPRAMPRPGRRKKARAERFLRSAIAELIAVARTDGRQRDDIFSRLRQARHPETGEGISSELLLDSLLTFMMVGHESTAKALTWTLYLLSQSDGWAERVRREVEQVAGTEPIAAKHIEQLQVTQQVVKEALRLYPPVPSICRHAARDVELGGRKIPAGTLVNIPIYVLHRHRQLWADPDSFDPDRFAPANAATMSRMQFLPFGAGPRTCMGSAFATIEATTVLATLIRGARFRLKPGHVPTPISRVTLGPQGGMPMSIELRRAPSSPDQEFSALHLSRSSDRLSAAAAI
jgi:cytochrome P450